MGGTSSTYGRELKFTQYFGCKNQRKGVILVDIGIDAIILIFFLRKSRPRCRWGDNIKMDLQEVGWEGVDWIDMAQDRDRWRALVNTVMNFGLHKTRGIS
jgi:hypothetical protein